ncbi:MAG: PD-(D/E)XK nuclease family protein [Polyangiales bacterium]
MADGSLKATTSASQLTTYSMCPRKYAFTYVWKAEPEFRSIALVTGTLVHGGIDWWFGEKLEGRTPTLEALDRIVEADVLAATLETDGLRWKDGNAEDLERDVKRFLHTYLAEFGEEQVKQIEAPFAVALVDADTGIEVGREMRGFLDLVLVDDRVVELKTSARGWRQDDLARHVQVGAYAYALHHLRGERTTLEVRVIVKLKGTPRVERHTISRGDSEIRWWLRAAADIEAAITRGHFPPAPSMLCGECEYQSQCLGMTEIASRSMREIVVEAETAANDGGPNPRLPDAA